MKEWYQTEERAMLALRRLYRTRGYLSFQMSKFEEYDLYAANKDFLVSDSVITFTDRTGRLLALKPDVTLSIVKNYTYRPGECDKLCYSERVYRPSGSTHEYKEILQTGLECLGELDTVHISEVIALAARSLGELGGRSVLELSHLGLLSALLDMLGVPESHRPALTALIGAKNSHDLCALCAEIDVDSAPLRTLIAVHGAPDDALTRLEKLCTSDAYQTALNELRAICRALSGMHLPTRIALDFSIVQDMRYYNSIVFRGYLAGLPERVLSGGRYDRLLRQMGKAGGAIGFAVYLDQLDRTAEEEKWDADLLLLYDETDDPAAVDALASKLSETGKRVMTQRSLPEKLRFGEVVRFGEEEMA